MYRLRFAVGALLAGLLAVGVAACETIFDLPIEDAADRLVEAETPQERAVRFLGLAHTGCGLMIDKGHAEAARPACEALGQLAGAVIAAAGDGVGFETAIGAAAVPGAELLTQYGFVTGEDVAEVVGSRNAALIALRLARGLGRIPATRGKVRDVGHTIGLMRAGSLAFEDAAAAELATLEAVLARF